MRRRTGEVAIHPDDGTTVVVTPWGRDQASWKHYQGGTAAKLWISREAVALDAPTAEHEGRAWEPLLDELLAPKTRIAWYGDRLLFASDTPGEGAARTDRASGNLWSVAADGTGLTRHTSLTPAEGYLREPATDGATIVFTSRGRLLAMGALDAEPREVEIRTAGVGAARRPRPVTPDKTLLALRPVHDARASVVEWRGGAHVLTHRGGPSRVLRSRCGLRMREVRPLGRSPFALYVTDEGAQADRTAGGVGSDALALRRLDGTGDELRVDVGEVGRILHAIPSPDGTKVAIATSEDAVALVTLRDVDTAPYLASVQPLGSSTGGEIRDLAWSPDSRWLVWGEPDSWQLSALRIVDTETPDPQSSELTAGRYLDSSPAFTRDGKHLVLLSMRTFETAYDDLVFDLGFVSAQRPFLLPLERATADPFGPLPDGWSAKEDTEGDSAKDNSKDGAEHSAGGSDEAPARTLVELEHAEDRIVPFPVESGGFSHLTAVEGGVVWLRHPQQGVLGTARAGVEGEAPKPTLEHWSFAARKLTTLAEGVTDLAASGDGTTLVIRQGETWAQVPADRKVEDDDPARIAIGTDRLRATVDPVAERRGMLWDNYRIMAQQFWREDMDGMDWHAMTSRYDPVIDRVVTDDDFQDLLWEVQGELGTSHAYVQGAPYEPAAPMRPGSLGADLVRRDGRWVIDRILPGDSSDPDARSPLLAPGVAAEAGDAVVRVDGRDVGADGVEPLLVGTADKPTEIVLERHGAQRRVVVTPLADDTQLRYQNWVASRRAAVRELSDGRLGYLHIPDMVSSGWAQMHRDLRDASTKEGILVDVRYNSGGHTSQLVTDRLARRVRSWGYPRRQVPDTYPSFAPRGPIALVTNHEAGSDGDIVGAVSRAMGIGPVIGTRTWGGVIGIDGRFDLVDGTGVTQPKYASWFDGEEWSIENYGVDPDIEVPFPPNAWVAGTDPQLERGVAEVLDRLEETPAATPPPLPAPRF